MKTVFCTEGPFLGKIYLKNETKRFFSKVLFRSFIKKKKKFRTVITVKKSRNLVMIETFDFFGAINEFKEKDSENNIIGEPIQNRKNYRVFHIFKFLPVFKINNSVILKKNIKEHINFLIINFTNDFAITKSLKRENLDKNKIEKELKKNFIRHIRLDKLSKFSRVLTNKKYNKYKRINYPNIIQKNFSPGQLVFLTNENEISIVCTTSDKVIDFLDFKGNLISVDFEKYPQNIKIIDPEKLQNTEGFDRNKNIIFRGDFCKIMSGINRFCFGVIQLIKGNKLFVVLNNSEKNKNLKIILISCNDIELIFQRKINYDNFIEIPLFSTKLIKKGPFKGYRGKILTIDSIYIHMEIFSTGKTIKIRRKDILG
jgi:hypothetical protein